MEEIKDMMLNQNEITLRKGIGRADGERAETERTLSQISISDCNRLSDESEQSRRELLQEIRQQQALNDVFRRMCEEALAITVSERTRHKADGVQKTNYSPALINTSVEGTVIDHDSFDLSEGVQDTLHTHFSGHMCCLSLGDLDTVNSNSHQMDCYLNLDRYFQSDHFLPQQPGHFPMVSTQDSQPQLALMPEEPIMSTSHSSESQPQGKETPVCWEHGCQGRVFSSWSNLRRHQKEKTRQEPACYCPRCGAYFSRTSGRNQHLANMSCTRIRRYSNGRIRPSILKIQETLDPQL